MSIPSDHGTWKYDDREYCPLCNRAMDTCRCEEEEIEEYYREIWEMGNQDD